MFTLRLPSRRALRSPSTAPKARADLLVTLALATTVLLCVVFAALIATSSGFGPFSTPVLRATLHTGPATAQRNELAIPAVSLHKHAPQSPALVEAFGKLPMSFEANSGQTDGNVKFVARGHGYSLFLTSKEAILALRNTPPASNRSKSAASQPVTEPVKAAGTEAAVIHMELAAANPSPRIGGAEELPGKVNYFIGNDPSKWRTNIPTYAKVKYEDVYPGVNLVYYGNQGQLEYDFVVAPRVDPGIIQLRFDGVQKLSMAHDGDLILDTSHGEVCFRKPVVYQLIGGAKKEVAGSYLLASNNTATFQIGDYDRSQPLVIDPVALYSTYLGGNYVDQAFGIAVDSAGNAYVTGITSSSNFPTKNPIQGTLAGSDNAFVSKINPSGSAFVYSTYLGGGLADEGMAIAVDSSGNAYVTGDTQSRDFPLKNPFQATRKDYDTTFVSKLDPTGSALVYSTFLGGSGSGGDFGTGIAVDGSGNAYVTGQTSSTDFPTANALQATLIGSTNGFVTKLNPTGSTLVYSTFLGGSTADYASGIAVDSSGSAYVTGNASSKNFPTLNALQGSLKGSNNAFISKINPAGSAFVYSTYLGGSRFDYGAAIAVDASGNAIITGSTNSTDFPTLNAFQPTLKGGISNALVSKINPSGTALVYSTYLGGSGPDYGHGIAVDASGNAYVIGEAGWVDFPTLNPLTPLNGGAFVTQFSSTGSLVYSTRFGGTSGNSSIGPDYGRAIAIDSQGNAYVTGYTNTGDFWAVNSLQPFFNGRREAFVAKLFPGTPSSSTSTTLVSSLNPSGTSQPVTFTATVHSGAGTPTGTVNFIDGLRFAQVALDSNGQASVTTSSLSIGSHTIGAQYTGDTNFASSSGTLTQVVNPRLVSFSIAPLNYEVAPGGTVQLTATGQYSDGSSQNLSSVATWTSSNTAAATVNSSGLVSAVAFGNTSITASYGGFTSAPATIGVVQTPVPSVMFVGGGSSAMFLELGQAAQSSGATATPCVWTSGINNYIQAADNRFVPPAPSESGEIWITWSPGTGSCVTPGGSFNVYSYVSLDSGMGNRCYFLVNTDGTAGCTQIVGVPSGTPGANLLCMPSPSNCISFGADTPLPQDVRDAVNGQHWMAAGTDMLPEDAKFATFRMLAPCGQAIYRQPFDLIVRQTYGLGYVPSARFNSGGTAMSFYSTNVSRAQDFNIVGNDPNSGKPVPGYTVSTIGAKPIIVAVGSAGGNGIGAATDIPGFVLMNFFNGTLGRATDLFGPTSPWGVTTLVDGPLSGAYNALEWSIVNSSQFHDSQDVYNCNTSTGVLVSNPLNLLSMLGQFANPSQQLSYRRRVIHTKEMVAQIQAGSLSDQRLGYFFWSAGNASSFTATNGKYLTVNGVDPLTDSYTDGVLPGADSSHPLSNATFKHLNEGDYPIWSAERIVSRSPVPAGVTNLIQAEQTLNATQHNFIPLSALKVWHSHYSVSAIGANTAANGTTINSPGDLCGTAGALAETGGDSGGATISIKANAHFCADYANTTGLISKTN